MPSKLLLFFAFILFSYGKEQDLNISADSITKNKDYIILKGNTKAKLGNFSVKSDSMTFNQKSKSIELKNNIELNYQNVNIKSNLATYDSKSNTIELDDLYFSDNDSNISVKSKNATICDGKYKFTESTLTSCKGDNPAWEMTFSSGVYDENTSNFYLENLFIKIYGIPLFYSPYLSIGNKVRKSGFLAPLFSISFSEFSYIQPIYFNISNSKDFEVSPQIRSNTGSGFNSIFRFADSGNSEGNLEFGYFNFSEKYKKANPNTNTQDIYGAKFDYDIFFQKNGYNKKALLFQLETFNRPKYNFFKQLDSDQDQIINNAISKLGYFYSSKNWGYVIAIKNNKDTRDIKKLRPNQLIESTLFPDVKIRKNINNLYFDNLYYSSDISFKKTKSKIAEIIDVEINMPIVYSDSFFYDYIDLEIKENLYYTFSELNIHNDILDNEFSRASNNAILSSDLVLNTKNFTHNVVFKVDYFEILKQKGNPIHQMIQEKEGSIIYGSVDKNKNNSFKISMDNNLFSNDREIISTKTYLKKDLIKETIKVSNELKVSFSKYFEVENKFYKNINSSELYHSYSSLGFSINDDDNFKLYHIYDDRVPSKKHNYFGIQANKKINSEYSILINTNYNQIINATNRFEIALTKDSPCFGYTIKASNHTTYDNQNRPKEDVVISLSLKLKPLGGV